MKNAFRNFVVYALILAPGVLVAGEKFDGNWLTTLTCPDKGKTEGYTWKFPGVVKDGNFRSEHGTAGQPGYLLIEGRIGDDGVAKLSANGIVASRKYGTGLFTTSGTDYSYKIKAQFKGTEGSGTRDEGLGIVGRPCTFDFVKQQSASQSGAH
jgi:hypothetical protein